MRDRPLRHLRYRFSVSANYILPAKLSHRLWRWTFIMMFDCHRTCWLRRTASEVYVVYLRLADVFNLSAKIIGLRLQLTLFFLDPTTSTSSPIELRSAVLLHGKYVYETNTNKADDNVRLWFLSLKMSSSLSIPSLVVITNSSRVLDIDHTSNTIIVLCNKKLRDRAENSRRPLCLRWCYTHG